MVTPSNAMPIRGSDRVATVLARDESLVEVFASVSPHFERLRNPGLRRAMARLVTVSAASRIAGVDEGHLLARLNAALVERPDTAREDSDSFQVPHPPSHEARRIDLPVTGNPAVYGDTPPAAAVMRAPAPFPSSYPPDRIVEVDVRDDLRRNREPFRRIMSAAGSLPPGHVLQLRVPFEPVPLYSVLGKQGFQHEAACLGEGDWCVWFFRERPDEAERFRAPSIPRNELEPDESDDALVVIDVRGLEPPEPMVRTLAALEVLPPGSTLLQLNVRVPSVLLSRLSDLGFTYRVNEDDGQGIVRLYIQRAEQPT